MDKRRRLRRSSPTYMCCGNYTHHKSLQPWTAPSAGGRMCPALVWSLTKAHLTWTHDGTLIKNKIKKEKWDGADTFFKINICPMWSLKHYKCSRSQPYLLKRECAVRSTPLMMWKSPLLKRVTISVSKSGHFWGKSSLPMILMASLNCGNA